MTANLEVDTEALNRLAARIRAAAAEAQAVAHHPGPLHASIDALGQPVLIRAVGAFVESWGAVLGEVVDDARRLADALALLARSYQDAESAITPQVWP